MKKAKKSQKVVSTYPMVNSPVECDINGIHSTLNFDMFTLLEFNRGEDSCIDSVKLQSFRKIQADGEYMNDEVQVTVNKSMVIIDGTHKFMLHKELGIPVNFRFTKVPELNSDDKVTLLGAVARLNAVNSKWNSAAHFNTALKLKLPLALEIEKIQAEYNEEYQLDGRTLSPNRVYSLLAHDKSRLESNMVTVEDYNKRDLIKRVDDPAFKNEMQFVCTILQELQEWNKVYEETAKITTFNMIRAAMPYVWENMLNMEMFVDEVKAVDFPKRFKNIANTVKGCTVYTNKLQEKLIKRG